VCRFFDHAKVHQSSNRSSYISGRQPGLFGGTPNAHQKTAPFQEKRFAFEFYFAILMVCPQKAILPEMPNQRTPEEIIF
jgi:hypothetical protein